MMRSLVAAGLCMAGLVGCAHNKANQYSYAPPLAPPVYPQPQMAQPVGMAAPAGALPPGAVVAPGAVMPGGVMPDPQMGAAVVPVFNPDGDNVAALNLLDSPQNIRDTDAVKVKAALEEAQRRVIDLTATEVLSDGNV